MKSHLSRSEPGAERLVNQTIRGLEETLDEMGKFERGSRMGSVEERGGGKQNSKEI